MKGNNNPSKDSHRNLYSQSFMPTPNISMFGVFLFIRFYIFDNMNAIWVAHDRNKDNSWQQSKPELLTLVSIFVRKFYPNFTRIIYLDDHTKNYLRQFGILSLFNLTNTSVLNKNYRINPTVFWAYSKLLAQRATKGPSVIFDLDFRIFQSLENLNFFDYDVSAFSLESIVGKYYYTDAEKCLENIVIDRKFEWDNHAVTVCCLYIKDNEFKNFYCDWALEYMYQWTYNHKGDNNDYGENFILFAEQYILAQLINREKKRLGLLVDDFQNGPLPSYAHSLGLNYENHIDYCFHYGNNKKIWAYGTKEYDIEIETILKYANFHSKDKLGLEVLNRIANIDDNDRCFRKLDQTIR
jgi:hypothetical protein